MIGKTLGHFRVVGKLGEGGMGEVYRATDTKLGRDVALTVLPAQLAGDAERLERFEREARAVASLNQMALRRRPFEGDSSAELASAILRDTPRPLVEIRTDLPGDLARVIQRCLEKDPGQRIQTARDVATELRGIRREPSSSVAGLDFTVGLLAEASEQAAKMIESDPDFYGAYCHSDRARNG